MSKYVQFSYPICRDFGVNIFSDISLFISF